MQPDLIMGSLAVLPKGLSSIHISSPVAGPLPAALARFARLHDLRLDGDASRVGWACHGGAALGAKLRHLVLRYDRPGADMGESRAALPVPAATADFLAAHAPRLLSLDVAAAWTGGDLPRLCRCLPALRTLRSGAVAGGGRVQGGGQAGWRLVGSRVGTLHCAGCGCRTLGPPPLTLGPPAPLLRRCAGYRSCRGGGLGLGPHPASFAHSQGRAPPSFLPPQARGHV